MIRLFVGYDPKEAAAYHVFCQSVIERTTEPVAFYPLHRGLLSHFDGKRDGSNAFTYSRFLVPLLCDFEGFAIFCDGDMALTQDIAHLWELKSSQAAVSVVKHDYQTKHAVKYVGTKLQCENENYPRKNWSSVILWNCGHASNRVLTREFVEDHQGSFLHRFSWITDDEIGELPHGWNHLVGEDPPGPAALYHYTLGVPGIKHYASGYAAWHWHASLIRSLECGDLPQMSLARAQNLMGNPAWPEKAA